MKRDYNFKNFFLIKRGEKYMSVTWWIMRSQRTFEGFVFSFGAGFVSVCVIRWMLPGTCVHADGDEMVE